MSKGFLEPGGPHGIRQTGPDKYEMSISVPEDPDGLLARECPVAECRPGYFKVKLGTGPITEDQDHVLTYCPYCRGESDVSDFMTKSQVQYAQDILLQEAHKAFGRAIEEGLGLGPSRRKRYGSGCVSMELSYKPGHPPPVRRPIEEELRRDIRCEGCELEHAVFGLAVWCPGCGTDIFLTHVAKEYESVWASLADVPRRREELGARVAARDIENALEDAVSIFEAVLKTLTRRALCSRGESEDQVDEVLLKKVRNGFQNVERAAALCRELIDVDLLGALNEEEGAFLRVTFEKRHPITHNLGIVDRKYLEKVRTGELEGRDVPVDGADVGRAIELSLRVLEDVHRQAVSGPPESPGSDGDER